MIVAEGTKLEGKAEMQKDSAISCPGPLFAIDVYLRSSVQSIHRLNNGPFSFVTKPEIYFSTRGVGLIQHFITAVLEGTTQ